MRIFIFGTLLVGLGASAPMWNDNATAKGDYGRNSEINQALALRAYEAEENRPATATAAADEVGLMVLTASSGGGGTTSKEAQRQMDAGIIERKNQCQCAEQKAT